MRRKMSGKKISVLVMSGMLAVLPVFPAMAEGWSQSGGKTYYYQQDGTMATGLRYMDGNYYYFMPDGSLVRGWLKLDGEYYYMQENGALTTGWRQINGDWYYLRPDSGKCVINAAVEVDGYWYFFKNDGKKLTGWLKKDGSFYYLDPEGNGRLTAGTTKVIDGASYSFGPDGVCISTGFVNNYYDANSGVSQTSGQTSGQTSSQSSSSSSRVVTAGVGMSQKGPGVQ